jgi:hypothetical protein
VARERRPLFGGESRWLDRFGSVLLLSTVSVVGLALVDISGPEGTVTRLAREAGALAAAIIVGATLLIALRASGINPRRQRLLDVVIGLTIVGYAITVLADLTVGFGSEQRNGISGAIAVLSVIAPVIVVLRLIRHRTVTMATMYGAIAAYLLLAVAYFFVFMTVGQWQGTFFTSPDEPSSSYMYFSLTTITTVGYGDLTAHTHLGRLLATSEAVVGQVYLVTFVAMIVGLRAQEWRNRAGILTAPPDSPEAAEQGPE